MATSTGLVSVIIPNYDGAHFLGPCLRSLFTQGLAEEELEVLIIDNGSRDGSVELVRREFSSVRVIANETNVGFTRAINQGLELARGEWILLLNNDTVLDPGALRLLLDQLRQSEEEVAGVQPLLLWAEDRRIVDSAGIALSTRFRARDDRHGESTALIPCQPAEVWGVCFGCALFRRQVFDDSGALDPDFFAERDDVDFCLRARWCGYRFMLVPAATVLHHRSPTSQRDPEAKFVRQRRNLILTCMKALPAGMAAALIAYRFQRDIFDLPHHLRNGRLQAVWKSWAQSIVLLPRMLRSRRILRERASLTSGEIRRQLRHFMQLATAQESLKQQRNQAC